MTKKSKAKKASSRQQPRRDPQLADVETVPTILTLNGETQPLDVIAPLSDSRVRRWPPLTPRIVAAAKASAIARYDWKNRGPACIGYTAGMGGRLRGSLRPVAGARPGRRPDVARAGSRLNRDAHGHLKGDALTWYE